MIKDYRIILTISSSDEKTLDSIYKALLPDTRVPPPDCNVGLYRIGRELVVELMCKRISLLRALVNSYFSIISMIMNLREETIHEPAKDST